MDAAISSVGRSITCPEERLVDLLLRQVSILNVRHDRVYEGDFRFQARL